jgi:sporulation protein YlmC with PRC-barrel domain
VKIVDKRAATKDAHEARDRKSNTREAGVSAGDGQFIEIGADARCSDGPCGQVRCVVVDPVAEVVTHLVIGSKHRHGPGRLVPPDLIEAAAGNEISLKCGSAAFEDLEAAEEIQFMPGSVGSATYGPQETLTLPYYGLGLAAVTATENTAQAVTQASLPLGEVGVHRDDCVHATDGEIGRVEGLVIERRTHHVTHVLLQEGHLWGRKDVAIPIRAVTAFGGRITLNIPKATVQSLPSVAIEHPAS